MEGSGWFVLITQDADEVDEEAALEAEEDFLVAALEASEDSLETDEEADEEAEADFLEREDEALDTALLGA